MIKNPEKYLQDFIDAGCDIITIHYEASKNIKGIIKKIKDSGKKVGISIKPKTPVNVLKKYLPDIDLILIMSVEPGFGGQKFMESVLKKVEYLKKMKALYNYKYLIEIDGGINLQTAPLAIKSGVDVLVIGSAIFSSDSPELAIKNFKKITNKKW
jgi:ribulose-phosphate 3-epimerase